MTRSTPASLQQLAKRLLDERLPIPEGRVGSIQVKHELYPAGKELTVVGFREAFFSGLPATAITLTSPTIVRSLCGDENGVWMTDQPCEIVQMWRELAQYARGNVLIGGLGLGVVSRMVALKAGVKLIDTVEISQDVIDLIAPHLNAGQLYVTPIHIVQADLYQYAAQIHKRQYSCALLDTWQGDGEWTWVSEVAPLRRALAQKIKHIYCWRETVMANQVAQMLTRACEMDAEMFRTQPAYYAFRRAMVDLKVRPAKPTICSLTRDFQKLIELDQRNQKDAELRYCMRFYLQNVGTPEWEKVFGCYWDEIKKG